MGSSKNISRSDVLRFNTMWDETDRKVIGSLLDGNPLVLAYKDEVEHRRAEIDAAIQTIPVRLDHMNKVSGSYVSGCDATGSTIFWIRPGAIDIMLPDGRLTVIHPVSSRARRRTRGQTQGDAGHVPAAQSRSVEDRRVRNVRLDVLGPQVGCRQPASLRWRP